MKALTASISMLLCSSLCVSAADTPDIAQTFSENHDSDLAFMSSVQSTTTGKNFQLPNSGTTMALIAGTLFAMLIVNRRAKYYKN